MYSDNEKQASRRRASDEFLRRMRREEFLSRMSANGDIPTISRTEPPALDLRPRASCDGSPLQEETERRDQPDFGCNMPSLAMVYSPYQNWDGLLSPDEGLAAGSLFRALIKPLEVGGHKGQSNCQGGCRR